MFDVRVPLGDTPAALAAPSKVHHASLQRSSQVVPPPDTASGHVDQQLAGKDSQRTSTESGTTSMDLSPQRPRKHPITPQLLTYRRFLRDREAIQRSESSARLKVPSSISGKQQPHPSCRL